MALFHPYAPSLDEGIVANAIPTHGLMDAANDHRRCRENGKP